MRSVLFVTPVEVDRPVDGLRWRAHLTARALASVADLRVLEVTTDGGRPAGRVVHTPRTPLRRIVSRIHPRLPARVAARDWRAAIAALEQIERVDLVWVMQPDLVGAGVPLPPGRLVVDLVDLEDGKYRGSSMAERLQRRRWRDLQAAVVGRADAVVVSHPGDAASIQHHRVDVLPNAVDVSAVVQQSDRPTLTLVGRFTYQPNLEAARWFVDAVWPTISRARPDARLLLVGRHDGALDGVARVDGVEAPGFVEDLEAIWQGSTALIAPIRTGTGTRLKIIEAFAREVPVVSTTLGCDGLAVEAERELLIADSADDFAAACLRLLDDADLRAALRMRAAELAREHHSPDAVERVVRTVVDSVMDERS